MNKREDPNGPQASDMLKAICDAGERCSCAEKNYQWYNTSCQIGIAHVNAISLRLGRPAQRAQDQDDLRSNALILLAAEDERQSRLHDLLETIREQIRLEVAPEHRPETLFKNIQDAVYAMRGRTLLLNDAAITSALTTPSQRAPDPIAETGKVHVLKTWPGYFNDILSGRKPFEWRVDDRYFAVGDTLILQEWEPERENLGCKEGRYTGREIRKLVSYVFNPFPTNKRTAIMALSAVTSTYDQPIENKRDGAS